ncbi:MAG TPA: tRNA (guanosine(37)-N1)-methyltransferase TrmD [Candidatus Binatia bacterium]|nr:tRNA (guanosine(37)-N1)-methyltransferase TrmD [Candidatus Binatia bacterium]
MKFIILTLFPEAFQSYFEVSLIKRGLAKKFIDIKVVNLRDYTNDPHKTVDDRPYGGGAGMVLRVDIIDKALKGLKAKKGSKDKLIILLTPQGKKFDQKLVTKLAKYKTIYLICGRYEGFDERVRSLVDIEISLGDFILTGGEIPAMAIVDAVSRLVPGFLGKAESLSDESFNNGLLEYPQYTRPEVYKKMRVPKVLLTGHHGKVKEWREQEARKRTKKRRPDLLK